MNTDKLIEVIKIQSEIIEILSREYTSTHRNPEQNQQMRDLVQNLKNLQKELM